MTPPDDRSGQYGVPYPGTGHDAFGAPSTDYGPSPRGHGAHGRPGGGQQFPQRGSDNRWPSPEGGGQDYGQQYGEQYAQPYPQPGPYGEDYGQPGPPDPYPERQVPESYAQDFPDEYPEDGPALSDDGPLIRPFAMTGGRTRPRYELAIEALVSSTAAPERIDTLLPEHQRICTLCEEIKSVAEVSALLTMPLGVARILVADLAEAGLVAIHQPAAGGESGGQPDVTLLERVLSGLRKL